MRPGLCADTLGGGDPLWTILLKLVVPYTASDGKEVSSVLFHGSVVAAFEAIKLVDKLRYLNNSR